MVRRFRGNRVGSIDPVTMEITEYTLPNPDARPDASLLLRTMWCGIRTTRAVIWAGSIPRRAGVREWPSPSGPRSRPYGIATVGTVVWYSESGVRDDTLVRFDTETEEFQTWLIPSGGGVVRNMMATADGNLVLACSAVNRIGLVEVRYD